MNLDEMNDCEILKEKRSHSEMYLENCWYDYAKSKNYKVGYVLIFHYRSDSEMLYIKLRKSKEGGIIDVMYEGLLL